MTRAGAAVLLLACVCCACKRESTPAPSSGQASENTVTAFLKNAERQSETDDQRREIQRALRDMLDKPEPELRQARYADYAGKANAWSITQVLQHYFAPNPPVMLDEHRFFQDVRAPAARAAVQHQLDEVNRALQ